MKQSKIVAKKWGIVLLLLAVIPAGSLTGCAPQAGLGINPYALVSIVDSADPTPLFVGTYNALISQGLTPVALQALQTAQTTTLTAANTQAIPVNTGLPYKQPYKLERN